ncbi:adenylate cyclase [Chryseolinea serpens]|uniref:Adenylate cyclase n=1 Tax=Chryseolinea serpens TaxID=947013 RepID=A0A1M5L495_9BACT|nr:adenylate/guanylate cyclase domain-containing protein [Chryseolinea serpens]SHG59838.1 adenylate cyclase [Chryseolinea serpens]
MRFWNENRKWIVIHTVTWCFAKVLFVAIKLWGLGTALYTTAADGTAAPLLRLLTPEVDHGNLFLVVAFSGVIDGLIFSWLDVRFDAWLRRPGFVRRVLVKGLANLCLGLALTSVLVPLLLGKTSGVKILSLSLMHTNLLVMAVYILLITFLLQLSKLAAAWIQTSDLLHILSPQAKGVEEERIFMFLDMKGSTTHAETLGPAKYSALIQDCFADMTKAAKQTAAEIYQYIGDEAVFTWKTSPVNFLYALQHFFYFRDHLLQRAGYYRKHYGLVPQFKAGIHYGKVVRTPVGITHKTLAFHGDAINTASRIQGKCNVLGRDLLVSAEVLEQVTLPCGYVDMGEHLLRGKDRKVRLYGVSKPPGADVKFLRKSVQKVTPSKTKVAPFLFWLNGIL